MALVRWLLLLWLLLVIIVWFCRAWLFFSQFTNSLYLRWSFHQTQTLGSFSRFCRGCKEVSWCPRPSLPRKPEMWRRSNRLWSPSGEESGFCPSDTLTYGGHPVNGDSMSGNWYPDHTNWGYDGAIYHLLCTWPRALLRPLYTLALWILVAFQQDRSHFIAKKAEAQWGCVAGKFGPGILPEISLTLKSMV